MLPKHLLVLAVTLWSRGTIDRDRGSSFWVQSFQFATDRQLAQPLRMLAEAKSISDIFVGQSATVTSVLEHSQTVSTHQEHTNHKVCNSRRKLLTTTFNACAVSSVSIAATAPKTAAYALQPRNEQFCSTGLFEHFMEYKCTPIGDIQDEGIGKEFTNVEEQTTNSLLSKLGIDDDTMASSKNEANKARSSPDNSASRIKEVN